MLVLKIMKVDGQSWPLVNGMAMLFLFGRFSAAFVSTTIIWARYLQAAESPAAMSVNPTHASVNWAGLILGAVMIIAAVALAVRARETYERACCKGSEAGAIVILYNRQNKKLIRSYRGMVEVMKKP